MPERKQNGSKQYSGGLNIHQAASAMQAARLNSVDLLDTADVLFTLKRFAHSVPFSILAIEESGKLVILQAILLGLDERARLWRSYRLHRAKTENLNLGIMARVRASFPGMSLEEAREIAARGPTPEDLETAKQRAVYSDCIESSGNVVCHLPRNVDWRQEAWDRLCEARAIVLAPRDRSPDELDVWVRHVTAAHDSGKSVAAILPDIHKELVERGFVEEGWWDTLLKDIEAQTRGV
jgi:AbiV family abortive infection protein